MKRADCIVVLHYKINEDKTLPKEEKLRIDKAIDLFKKGYAKKIIMSGGKANKFGVVASDLMKEYAVSGGVPKYCVLKEKYSKDTVGNICYVKRKFLIPRKWKKIIIVTSDYHIPRTKFICSATLEKKYKVKFVPVDPELDPEIKKEIESGEKTKILETRLIQMRLGRIRRGDDKSMLKLLLETHYKYKNS